MTKYNYKHEKMLYCGEIFADSKQSAKYQYKQEHNIKRLPNGFEIWKA